MDDLLRRWIESFDELEKLDHYKSLVTINRYAPAPGYGLQYFENGKFSDKEEWMEREEAADWRETFTYGFNEQGLPCYMTSRHNYNKTTWAGFYSYSEQLVEHFEFNLDTGVTSCFERIEYRDGKKAVYFRLRVNGGGSFIRDQRLPKEEKARQMIESPNDLMLSLYTYGFDEHGKTIRADGLHKMPGFGHFTSRDEYVYDAEGTLLTIRRFFSQGTDRLIYSRIPPGTSAEMIIDKLAAGLSVAIVDALVHDRQKEADRSGSPETIEEPIGLINLTYSYADNYYPSAGYQLVRTIQEDLEEGIFDFYSFVREAQDIETGHLEDLYVQLEQLMEAEADSDLGRDMLRKVVAILVRTRLHARLPVSDDFGGLVMDGHIEGHSIEEMEEILLACGNDPEVISIWRGKGMV